MNYKLNFELIPDSCWFSNLRSALPKEVWDKIRKKAYAKAGGKCSICGKNAKLEAHESWEYDEKNNVQKLKRIIAVCHDCHSVIHIGRTQLKGDIIRAENHFIKVNKCTYADYIRALGKANEDHIRRNKISEWKLDLSYLKRYVKED